MTSQRESVRQLQNTLSVSVYRWKYKALSDWSIALATRFQLTNQRLDDIKSLLSEKYPNAFKVFRISEFKAEKADKRWPLLLHRMSSSEALVHAAWEFVQQLTKAYDDSALKVALGSTCFEAGLKELERSKQTLISKPRKKRSLVRSLVRSKRWSLPQYYDKQRRSCMLAGYRSPINVTPRGHLSPHLSPNSSRPETTSVTSLRLGFSTLSGIDVRALTPVSEVDLFESEISDLESSDDELTSPALLDESLLTLETVRERTWEQGWVESKFVEETKQVNKKKKSSICFGDCFCLPRDKTKTKVESVAL